LSPGTGFLVCFALTLVFLAAVFVTGFRARRVMHVGCVVATLGALYATIRYAYELGHIYDLPAAGWITPFHLFLAKLNTAAFLLPIATGLRTVFVPSTRRLHKKLAFAVLGLTLVTATTGGIMLWLAPRHA
jgi:hypothetical protein